MPNINLSHVAIQLSQHHLSKVRSFLFFLLSLIPNCHQIFLFFSLKCLSPFDYHTSFQSRSSPSHTKITVSASFLPSSQQANPPREGQ